MPQEHFGTYLKKLRNLRKMSISTLAELANVSPSYISQIENGGRGTPQPEILKRIAPHLQVGYYELMVKAGYLTKSPEDLRIDDDKTKELFSSLNEGKKELLKVTEGLSEDTIFMFAKIIRQIKDDTNKR